MYNFPYVDRPRLKDQTLIIVFILISNSNPFFRCSRRRIFKNFHLADAEGGVFSLLSFRELFTSRFYSRSYKKFCDQLRGGC